MDLLRLEYEKAPNTLVELCLWNISNHLFLLEQMKDTSHLPDDVRSRLFHHLKGYFLFIQLNFVMCICYSLFFESKVMSVFKTQTFFSITHLETGQINDTIVEKLFPRNQRFVILSECISITNRSLSAIVNLCGSQIITLHLADCYKITGWLSTERRDVETLQ
jgi:hypothetical protein